MSPLELLGWVGTICVCLVTVAITAAIVVGCVKAIARPARGKVIPISQRDGR